MYVYKWELLAYNEKFSHLKLRMILLMAEIQQPPGMVLKPVLNNGINYQPQLVQDFSHQQYVCVMYVYNIFCIYIYMCMCDIYIYIIYIYCISSASERTQCCFSEKVRTFSSSYLILFCNLEQTPFVHFWVKLKTSSDALFFS